MDQQTVLPEKLAGFVDVVWTVRGQWLRSATGAPVALDLKAVDTVMHWFDIAPSREFARDLAAVENEALKLMGGRND